MSESARVVERRSLFSGQFSPAPIPLVAAAAVAIVVGIVMVFAGAAKSGVTTDEPLHVKRLQAFLTDGLYVLNSEREATGPDGVPDSAYVYGPATALTMHWFNVRAGNENAADDEAKVQDPDVVSWRVKAYIVRHFAVASLSMLASLAVFGLGWLLLGSWRWGVVAAGVLAAIPAWTGSAMFNMKDSPVGTGYTVMTFGLVATVMATKARGRLELLECGLAAVSMVPGIALMVGTRPGMWPAALVAVIALFVIMAIGGALHWQLVATLLAGLAMSYAALWHIYPRVFSTPITMLRKSVSASTEFPHSLPPGRGYVVQQTFIEWPIFLLLFMALGTVVAATLCWKLLANDPFHASAFALVGAQAFVMPLAAMVMNANLYHGLRQLLFAFPGQAVLATVGIAAALSAVPTLRGRRLLAGVAIAALAFPMVVQARMFPYQYAYGNVAAELSGAFIGNDYFRSSFREYVDDVPSTMGTRCLTQPVTGRLDYNSAKDCRNVFGSLKPFWLEHWKHARYDPDSQRFYLVSRYQAGVPDNCRVIREVTRHRNLKRVVMSRLSDCVYEPGP
jgi:hypothetical protein